MDRNDFFDLHAKTWNNQLTCEKTKRIKKILKHAGLTPGQTILDIGTGTGVLLPFLRKAVGTKSKIWALDYAKEMIKRARKINGKSFKYVHADAQKIPAKNNFFDHVICFSVFPHFSNKLKTLKEIYRVLKPCGRVMVAHSESRQGINAFHNKLSAPVKHDALPPAHIMKKLFKASGFHVPNIHNTKTHYIASAIKKTKKIQVQTCLSKEGKEQPD